MGPLQKADVTNTESERNGLCDHIQVLGGWGAACCAPTKTIRMRPLQKADVKDTERKRNPLPRPHPGTRWLGRSMLRPYKGEEGNHRRSRMISRAALAPQAVVMHLPGCDLEPDGTKLRIGALVGLHTYTAIN